MAAGLPPRPRPSLPAPSITGPAGGRLRPYARHRHGALFGIGHVPARMLPVEPARGICAARVRAVLGGAGSCRKLPAALPAGHAQHPADLAVGLGRAPPTVGMVRPTVLFKAAAAQPAGGRPGQCAAGRLQCYKTSCARAGAADRCSLSAARPASAGDGASRTPPPRPPSRAHAVRQAGRPRRLTSPCPSWRPATPWRAPPPWRAPQGRPCACGTFRGRCGECPRRGTRQSSIATGGRPGRTRRRTLCTSGSAPWRRPCRPCPCTACSRRGGRGRAAQSRGRTSCMRPALAARRSMRDRRRRPPPADPALFLPPPRPCGARTTPSRAPRPWRGAAGRPFAAGCARGCAASCPRGGTHPSRSRPCSWPRRTHCRTPCIVPGSSRQSTCRPCHCTACSRHGGRGRAAQSRGRIPGMHAAPPLRRALNSML